MTTTAQFTDTLLEALAVAEEEGVIEPTSVRTFEEAMLLTPNTGVIVTLVDGSQFQLTIVQSKGAF